MTTKTSQKNQLLSRVWSSLTRSWSVRVPDEVSCCEFECRKAQCVQGDWERCEARLDYADRLRSQRGGRQGAA